jgi:hypothetical protein
VHPERFIALFDPVLYPDQFLDLYSVVLSKARTINTEKLLPLLVRFDVCKVL